MYNPYTPQDPNAVPLGLHSRNSNVKPTNGRNQHFSQQSMGSQAQASQFSGINNNVNNPVGNIGQPSFGSNGQAQYNSQPNEQFNTYYGNQAASAGVAQGYTPSNVGNPQILNNFFNDPRTNIGLQMGSSALAQGSQLMEQTMKPYMSSASDLKNLFKVSNKYVLHKMYLILFPYRHSSWSRMILNNTTTTIGSSSGSATHQNVESFELPKNDINSPDLYIPLMSYITYILLLAIIQGLKGEFHPEMYGYTSSVIFGYQLLDFFILKLGLYLLNVESSFWDLVAYSNYKFIPLILILVLKNFYSVSSLYYWLIFAYLDFSFAFFLMRSLKNVFLGNGINSTTQTMTNKERQKRIYFIFSYSYPFQMVLMWLLM